MSDWGDQTVRGEKVKALCEAIYKGLKDAAKGATMAEIGLAFFTVYNHYLLAEAAQEAEGKARRLKG